MHILLYGFGIRTNIKLYMKDYCKVKGKANKEQLDKIIFNVNEGDDATRESNAKDLTDYEKEKFKNIEILLVQEIDNIIYKMKVSDKNIQMITKRAIVYNTSSKSESSIRRKLLRRLHKNFRELFR